MAKVAVFGGIFVALVNMAILAAHVFMVVAQGKIGFSMIEI
jgi:hypothetical protein